MPGGKGNITPEEGKQFSKDYQPAEKWTEEKALELGNELIEWLKVPGMENMFYEEFLVIHKDLYSTLTAYLCKKFSSFSNLIKRAEDIQKAKLIKYGVIDKTNATMTKFVLMNNHGMSERSEQKIEAKIDVPLFPDIKP